MECPFWSKAAAAAVLAAVAGLWGWACPGEVAPQGLAWLAVAVWAWAASPGRRPGLWRLGWLFLLATAALQPGNAGPWVAVCFCLGALVGAEGALRAAYRAEPGRGWLLLCGTQLGLAAGAAPVAGAGLAVALALFGWLHHFLHEREEKHLLSTQVSAGEVGRRWLLSWGLWCLLPGWGLWHVLSGRVAPLWAGRWAGGYFGGFQAEWLGAWTPPGWQSLIQSACLLAVGVLPIWGLLGSGKRLPDRFIYRLLQASDEQQLLLWLGALAMIVATFWDGRSYAVLIMGVPAWWLVFSTAKTHAGKI